MEKIQKSLTLVLSGLTTLLITIAFADYNLDHNNASTRDWLIAKNEGTISCGPDNSKVNKSRPTDAHENTNPGNNDTNNGCMHQQATGELCRIRKSKLWLIKNHTC